MSKYGTRLIETEALMAALSKDQVELVELISNMNAHEQRELARACDRLKNELWYTLSKDKGVDNDE